MFTHQNGGLHLPPQARYWTTDLVDRLFQGCRRSCRKSSPSEDWGASAQKASWATWSQPVDALDKRHLLLWLGGHERDSGMWWNGRSKVLRVLGRVFGCEWIGHGVVMIGRGREWRWIVFGVGMLRRRSRSRVQQGGNAPNAWIYKKKVSYVVSGVYKKNVRVVGFLYTLDL